MRDAAGSLASHVSTSGGPFLMERWIAMMRAFLVATAALYLAGEALTAFTTDWPSFIRQYNEAIIARGKSPSQASDTFLMWGLILSHALGLALWVVTPAVLAVRWHPHKRWMRWGLVIFAVLGVASTAGNVLRVLATVASSAAAVIAILAIRRNRQSRSGPSWAEKSRGRTEPGELGKEER